MKKIFLFLSLSVFTAGAQAQIDSALAAQLQAELDAQVTLHGNHGVSAHLIMQNGQTWTGTSGVDGQSMPMTDTTVFIGASTSKMNIAILLLMFAEDSLIDLDDTWHQYLPNLNVAFDTNITIRQLLNHTSGIADYLEVPANAHYVTSDFNTFYTPQDILENIVSGVPDFPAGTNFNYSNSNYALAAYVAEAATPNTLQSELRTRIWNPTGMQHTYFGAYDSIPDPMAGVWWNFGAGVTDYSGQPYTSMFSFGYGTDNVITCPTDLARLVNALLNNQLLGPQAMNEMLTFIPQSYVQWTGGYGLGIHHLLGQNVDTVLGHDGKFCNLSDAFHSGMCGFTLATMTNTQTLWEGIYNAMYDIIRNYYQCNSVPVADFSSNMRVTCEGNTITFTDNSTNVRPAAWNWSFPGGTLTNGTTVNDSIPQVIYANAGTYDVSLTASSAAGSDSITKSGYITILSGIPAHDTAFTEGFETAAVPGPDWSISSNNGTDWNVTSLAAATGSKSVYIDNYSNAAGNISSLVSSVFDVSGFSIPRLTFKRAYRQKTASDADKLQVYTSTSCGVNWVLRYSKAGATLATVSPPSAVPFVPTTADFTADLVSISNVTGSQSVLFKFNFIADPYDPGNNIFIDDINIFDAALGIEEIDSPAGLVIYPSPSSGEVNIATTRIADEITVTDVLGKIVFEQRPAGKNISITLAQEGMYFVLVRAGRRTTAGKIFVAH